MASELFSDVVKYMNRQQLSAVITVIKGYYAGKKLLIDPDRQVKGSLGDPEADDKAIQFGMKCMENLQAGRTTLGVSAGEVEIFVDVLAPLPRLIIIGGVHIAAPLIRIAKVVNIYTVLVDARSAFANRERFPDVDELIVEWPADALKNLFINETTFIVTLTHDDKFDVPALAIAVDSPALYIGALGSKKTHANRIEKLKELGATDAQIARIHTPIGLNIGAENPEQIALSIIAEIISSSHGINHPVHPW